MTIAFCVNAAFLVLAALVFYGKESVVVAGGEVVKFSPETDWIRIAHLTLAPLLGTTLASTLFAGPYWPAAKAAPSRARWPARWSWKDSCTGGFVRGSGA